MNLSRLKLKLKDYSYIIELCKVNRMRFSFQLHLQACTDIDVSVQHNTAYNWISHKVYTSFMTGVNMTMKSLWKCCNYYEKLNFHNSVHLPYNDTIDYERNLRCNNFKKPYKQ